MSAMAEHRKTGTASTPWAAWAVLIGMGGTSVTYNVYHAVHHSGMNPFLALLYGLAPVAAAALLSHIVAELDGGWFMKAVTFAVMLGAMGLSIGATASVVRPAAGSWMQYLFGAVLDAAALVALQRILSGHKRKAEEASALAAAEQDGRDAAGRAELAEAERARLAAEMTETRAALEAELAAVRTELTAANATVDALRSKRVPARKRGGSSGRKRATTSPRNGSASSPLNSAAGSPQNPGTSSPLEADAEADLGTEALALKILAAEPDISGSELGVRLGKTKRYGCILKNNLAPVGNGPDGPDAETGDAG